MHIGMTYVCSLMLPLPYRLLFCESSMQNITYKFTIVCQEPGHILLGLTTTAPMTLRPDVQAWSDCLRCFAQTGWKKTANILKSMTCTATTPGSFVISGTVLLYLLEPV